MNNRRIEGLGMLSPVWGPFSGPLDASENLRKFTDIAAGPGLGIVWVSCGKLYAIRKPFYDASGAGEIIAYEFGALPPPPTPPTSSGTGVRGWFSWLAGEISKGKAAVGREVGVVEGGLARVWRNNFGMTPHQSDGVGVALDVVGVGLSFALMSFGPLELLGAVALVGGVALLVADGLAYGTEMAGYDETAKSIRYYTFWPRCLATVMTLPDAIWGVGKVLLESGRDGCQSRKFPVHCRSCRRRRCARDRCRAGCLRSGRCGQTGLFGETLRGHRRSSPATSAG